MKLVSLVIYSIVIGGLLACDPREPTAARPLWQPNSAAATTPTRVALRVNPASYYWLDGQETGFDYQLLQAFADYAQTALKIIPVATAAEAVDLLAANKADMAVGGLSTAQTYQQHFALSDPYYESARYMIYRYPDVKPESFAEMAMPDIDVSENSDYIELLEKLYRQYNRDAVALATDERWYLHANTSSYKLIEMVNLGLIRYALADAYELSATQLLYPYVKTAFSAAEKVPIVWLFNRSAPASTPSMLALSNDFFKVMRNNGELERIVEAHFDHLELLSYAEKLTFIELAYKRLSEHKRYFKLAADRYHFDWKLLAALAYQESHWRARAVSPTGVKGMMMLTQEIAQRYEVHDRLDAYQSIMGGSRYLSELLARVPPEVPPPDRIWMALVAYLAGFGHLQDALALTEERAANTASWRALSETLKLLQKPEWYQKAKYGKPRDKVVLYVNNIRNYQFLLSLLEDAISTEIRQPYPPSFITPRPLS